MISLIYRLTEHETDGNFKVFRPHWYRKDKCLRSFLHAVEFAKDVIDRVIFVHDGPEGILFNMIPDKFDVVKINTCDNLKSYHTVLGIADNLNSNLYFVEDDYLHKPESILSLDLVLPDLKYASTYNHPVYRIEDWDAAGFPPIKDNTFISKNNKYWKITGYCCYTYGIENSVYKEVSPMLKAMGLFDIGTSVEMHRRGFPLWTSEPGLSTQVDPYLSLGVDWEAFNNSISINYKKILSNENKNYRSRS
jgi:hypothetical protein